MDGFNEPDENGKISNLLDPDAEKQTFGRKSQNCPNLRTKMAFYIKKKYFFFTKSTRYYTYSFCNLQNTYIRIVARNHLPVANLVAETIGRFIRING
ncbi:hypothetical protein Hanom_Chr11g01040541 [Helianthus anomalus]